MKDSNMSLNNRVKELTVIVRELSLQKELSVKNRLLLASKIAVLSTNKYFMNNTGIRIKSVAFDIAKIVFLNTGNHIFSESKIGLACYKYITTAEKLRIKQSLDLCRYCRISDYVDVEMADMINTPVDELIYTSLGGVD